MQPKKPARVLGPYQEGPKWRLITVGAEGRRSRIVRSESAARRLKQQLMASLVSPSPLPVIPLDVALREYQNHLRRQRSRQTVTRTIRTLRAFLPEPAAPLTAMSPKVAHALARFEHHGTRRIRRSYSASTRRAILGHVHRFYEWTQQRQYLVNNPFAGVQAVGIVGTAARRLYVDELPRFTAAALCAAEAGDVAELGALLILLANLRSKQVRTLRVQDVDLDKASLRVAGASGPAWRAVPEELLPALRVAVQSRPPSDLLLGPGRTGNIRPRNFLWRTVQRLCLSAKVTSTSPRLLGILSRDPDATGHRLSRQIALLFAQKRRLHTPSVVLGRRPNRRARLAKSGRTDDEKTELVKRMESLFQSARALFRGRSPVRGR